jgi:hypothetical protein
VVKKIFKLLNFKGIIIFINNMHKKEFAINNLINIENQKCIFVYRTTPAYQVNEDKILLNKFFFFILSFILGFKFKNKFVMIFSQPYFAIPYFLLGSHISVYFYDVHIGLLYESKIKLFVEKISILFFKNIIHRDLRLWVEYKYLLKKKFRKNLLIPDFVINKKKNKVKISSDKIKCAVIGWVDDNFVKVDQSIKILASLGVEIYFFTSKNSFDLSIKNLSSNEKLMKQIHYVGYLDTNNLEKYLEDFSIGLCPHDAKKPMLSINYRTYCSSMRVIDYIQNSLTIFLSNKTIFQNFINKRYNANFHNINDLKLIKTIHELKKKIIIKDIFYDKSIFNKKKLSKKLINFLTFN